MFKERVSSLLAILSLLAFVQSAPARVISDPAIGYSIEIPDDWRDIPQADFDAAMKATLQSTEIQMLRGFEPASHTGNFQSPFLLIATAPYGSGTPMTSVNAAFLKDILKGLTGLAVDDFKKGLTPQAASKVSSIDRRAATYFTSPPGFAFAANVESAGKKSHSHSIGLVGRDRYVYANFNCLVKDAASLQPVVDAVASAFRLDPSQQVAFKNDDFTVTTFPAAKTGAIVGAIAGALGGGVFVLARSRKKKRPPS